MLGHWATGTLSIQTAKASATGAGPIHPNQPSQIWVFPILCHGKGIKSPVQGPCFGLNRQRCTLLLQGMSQRHRFAKSNVLFMVQHWSRPLCAIWQRAWWLMSQHVTTPRGQKWENPRESPPHTAEEQFSAESMEREEGFLEASAKARIMTKANRVTGWQ